MLLTVRRLRHLIREEMEYVTPADEGEMAVALDDAVAYIASVAQVSYEDAYDFFRAHATSIA